MKKVLDEILRSNGLSVPTMVSALREMMDISRAY